MVNNSLSFNATAAQNSICSELASLAAVPASCCSSQRLGVSMTCTFTVAPSQSVSAAASKLQALALGSAAGSAMAHLTVVGSTGSRVFATLVGSPATSAASLVAASAALSAAYDATSLSAGGSTCGTATGVAISVALAAPPGSLVSATALAAAPVTVQSGAAGQINVTNLVPLTPVTLWTHSGGGVSTPAAFVTANTSTAPAPPDYSSLGAQAKHRLQALFSTDRRFVLLNVVSAPVMLWPYKLKRSYAIVIAVIMFASLLFVAATTPPTPPVPPPLWVKPDPVWPPVVTGFGISPMPVASTVPAGVTVTLQALLNSSMSDTLGVVWNQLAGPPVSFAAAGATPPPGAALGRLTTTLTFPAGMLAAGTEYAFQCVGADDAGSASSATLFRVAPSPGGFATLTASRGVNASQVVLVAPAGGAPAVSYSLTASIGGLPFASFPPQPSPSFTFALPAGAISIQGAAKDGNGSVTAAQLGVYALPGDSDVALLNPSAVALQLLNTGPVTDDAARLLLAALADASSAASATGRRLHAAPIAVPPPPAASSCGQVCRAVAAVATAAQPTQGVLLALWGARTFPEGLSKFMVAATTAAASPLSPPAVEAALELLSIALDTPGADAASVSRLADALVNASLAAAVATALGAASTASLASNLLLDTYFASLGVHCDALASSGRLFAPLILNTVGVQCTLPDNSTFSRAPTSAACVACLAIAADPGAGVPTLRSAVQWLNATVASGVGPLHEVNTTTPLVFTFPPTAPSSTCLVPGSPSTPCATLPSAVPPGHSVALNLTDPSSPSWSLSGPLTAGCTRILLNCTAGDDYLYAFLRESQAYPPRVYLSPGHPFDFPTTQCGTSSSGGNSLGSSSQAQVFFGDDCQLWQAGNPYNCSFDAGTQAFVGTGCVPSPVSCACAALPVAWVPVNSGAGVMTVLTADEAGFPALPVQLTRGFLYSVAIAVCASIVGTYLLASGISIYTSKRGVSGLQTHQMGFLVTKDGAWLWALHLHAADDPDAFSPRFVVKPRLGRPGGSAVAVASAIGLPLVRLRSALPDVLWPPHARGASGVAVAVGRPAGMSKAALRATEKEHRLARASMLAIRGLFSRWRSVAPQPHSASEAPASSSSMDSESTDMQLEDMFTGTALMYAHIAITMLMPLDQLLLHEAASARALAKLGMRRLGRWTLRSLRGAFYAMLSSDSSLRSPDGPAWVEAARVWSLVLSQRRDGAWAPDASFAAALSARHVGGPEDEERGEEDDATSCLDVLRTKEQPKTWPCPLTFSPLALLEAAPPGLKRKHALQLQGNGGMPPRGRHRDHRDRRQIPSSAAAPSDDDEDDGRTNDSSASIQPGAAGVADSRALCTWCTLLAVERLAQCDEMPIFEDGSTVVDRAAAYLKRKNFHPAPTAWNFAVRQALDSWAKAEEEAQDAALGSKHVAGARGQRWWTTAVVTLVQCARTHHDTFSAFLAPGGTQMTRVQRGAIAVTAFIAPLAGLALLQGYRGQVCCTDLRTALTCPSNPDLPCRGIAGITCSQLAVVLASVQDTGLAGYACTRFPDPNSASQQTGAASLVAAFASVVTWLVRTAIVTTNRRAADAASGGVQVAERPPWYALLFTRLAAPDRGARIRDWRWRAVREAGSKVENAVVDASLKEPLIERAVLLLTRLAAEPVRVVHRLWRCRLSREEYAIVTQVEANIPAFPLIVGVWALLVFTLLIGLDDMLWYLGDSPLSTFIPSAAVAYAVDQLAQWRDLYQDVFQQLFTDMARELVGMRPTEELWPDVLNFFSLQALILPARAAEERPPDLVHQAAILYAASHAVDDL